MKTFPLILGAALAALSPTPAARAQTAGLYQLSGLNGTPGTTTAVATNSSPPGTTNQFVSGGVTNQFGSATSTAITTGNGNTNLVQDIHNYDNVGFTYQAQLMVGDTNTTVFGWLVFRSFDRGTTFETKPNWIFTNNPSGPAGTIYGTLTNLSTQGVTTLAFSYIDADTNTLNPKTNILLELFLKREVYLVKTADN